MPHVLKKIEPLYVTVTPPKNDDGTLCQLVGSLEDGRPIYRKTIVRASAHEAKKDEAGNELWGKNPVTGDRTYQKFTRHAVTITLFVVPNNQGNGNLTWDEYFFPTEAELRSRARRQQIEVTKDELAAALVDGDVNIADLISAVRAGKMPATPRPDQATGEAAPTAPILGEEFPKPNGIGRWMLSDGTEVKGKKVDAIAAQEKLATAASADLDRIPES